MNFFYDVVYPNTLSLQVIITKGDLIPGTIVYYEDDEHQPSVDYEAEKGSWHTLIISGKYARILTHVQNFHHFNTFTVSCTELGSR